MTISAKNDINEKQLDTLKCQMDSRRPVGICNDESVHGINRLRAKYTKDRNNSCSSKTKLRTCITRPTSESV